MLARKSAKEQYLLSHRSTPSEDWFQIFIALNFTLYGTGGTLLGPYNAGLKQKFPFPLSRKCHISRTFIVFGKNSGKFVNFKNSEIVLLYAKCSRNFHDRGNHLINFRFRKNNFNFRNIENPACPAKVFIRMYPLSYMRHIRQTLHVLENLNLENICSFLNFRDRIAYRCSSTASACTTLSQVNGFDLHS